MKRNAVGWFEIYVDDIESAKTFYQTVFETELTKLEVDMPGLEMWAFPMDEEGAGAPGAIAKMEGAAPGTGGTIVYFSSKDCSVEQGRVQASGGEVVAPKFSIGQYGFITICKDPAGNTIGIHSHG